MIENTITTTSEIMQDNSSTECVSTETNPTNTVQSNELIFGQKHNDIDCALCPTAKRACDRAWCTAKNLEVWSEMSKKTLWRWLEKLEKARRISLVSDMTHVNVPTTTGAVKTTFYNLNVLNQLAMVCIDNEKLNEVSCKFSDILSEVETTGSYSVNHTQPQFAIPKTLPEALRLCAAEIEAKEKALQERDETKALLAEEKEKVETLNEKVDDLERTKSWIGDKKVASAMGTAGALSKKCGRLEKELDQVKSERDLQIYNACSAIRKEYEESWTTAREWCYKHGLPVYDNQPKLTVSARLAEICSMYPEREQWRTNAYGIRMFPKWACDILDKMYDEDDTFLSEYRAV